MQINSQKLVVSKMSIYMINCLAINIFLLSICDYILMITSNSIKRPKWKLGIKKLNTLPYPSLLGHSKFVEKMGA
jgi:hypothetical protein